MEISTLEQFACSFLNSHLVLVATLVVVILYFSLKPNRIYLVDFSCYQAPGSLRSPNSTYMEHLNLVGKFSDDSIEFLSKLNRRSGISSESFMPASMHQLPPDISVRATMEETESVLFPLVEELLLKHNISPKSIDILISNCSLFSPTPSITATIINKFGFRSNVMSFNLSGMGCSGGLLSVSLAKDLLKVRNNSLALILSMESLSTNGYIGPEKNMLLTNILFRTGGAAVLLSNHRQHKNTAKYTLQHFVRTNQGADDQSYKSVFQEPDEYGSVGVSLSIDLLHAARKALRTNLLTLGPLVLPYSEQILYGWSIIRQKMWRPNDLYVPDFKKAFDHFCIHAGGRAVIDAVEDSLSLCEEDGEASRMTLYRYGNTSSSSIWYELDYLEAKGRVKRGDKVWQIAFGSGFKCNSAVWKCIKDLDPSVRNAWSDRIHLYPVGIAEEINH